MTTRVLIADDHPQRQETQSWRPDRSWSSRQATRHRAKMPALRLVISAAHAAKSHGITAECMDDTSCASRQAASL
jgi:hypothetical protein